MSFCLLYSDLYNFPCHLVQDFCWMTGLSQLYMVFLSLLMLLCFFSHLFWWSHAQNHALLVISMVTKAALLQAPRMQAAIQVYMHLT